MVKRFPSFEEFSAKREKEEKDRRSLLGMKNKGSESQRLAAERKLQKLIRANESDSESDKEKDQGQ